jgi:radical SAM superfamily enzyme YgiQ (UPF0313 family)
MTKVDTVFVGAEYEENLSSRTMAAVARDAGFSSRIVAFNRERDMPAVLAGILGLDPALVGLSIAFQHRAPEFLALASALRNEGYTGHIVAGGHFPTAVPVELLRYNRAVDTVVRYDGEGPLQALLARFGDPSMYDQVPALSYRVGDEVRSNPPEPAPRDLDSIPWPVRDTPLPRHLGIPFTTLWGSRGCYGNCTFCAINSYHRGRPGPRLRFRSPASIAAEMAVLYHQKGARIFCFHDDTWFLPKPSRMKARMDELAAHLGKLDVRQPYAIVAKARPDALDTALLDHLNGSVGLMRLYIGVENFSEAGIEHLGRRVTRDQIDTSLEACVKAGVYGCYNLLLFEPDSRLEDMDANLAGMRKHGSIPVNFCRAEAYNGTALHTYLRDSGRLRGNYLASDYEIADPRMEMLFRIVYQGFKDRNFAEDALANMNMSLGYELQLIAHFGRGLDIFGLDEITADVNALIREININSVTHLEEAVRFVRSGGYTDGRATVEFTVQLASKVNFEGAVLHTRLLALREDLKRMSTHLPAEVRPEIDRRGETSTPAATIRGS